MSKQASKKNIAQNNETFVATIASGALPKVGAENKTADSLIAAAKNKQNKKANTEKLLEENEQLEQAAVETPVFEQLSEELALVEGLVEGDTEITLTQARSSDGAAAFFGSDGWGILGGALLLGGVVALASGGGGGGGSGTATPACGWEALEVTDEDVVLTGDLTDVGDITVLATSAETDASLYTSADVEIHLCDHGTNTNNLTADASGFCSEIDVGITVVGNLDDINVTASGQSSDVSLSMELAGNIDGDILISSTSADADTEVGMFIDGDINSSTVEIEATADDSSVDVWIQTLGDIDVGSLSVIAGSECADITGAYAGLFLGASGDITVTDGISAVAYEDADVDLFVGATGSIAADLELDAIGEDSTVEFAGISGLTAYYTAGEDGFGAFTDTWTGDITLTASGFSSEIQGGDALYGVCGDLFGADTGILVLGSYQGDSISMTAEGEDSLITGANVTVIGGNMSSLSEVDPLNISLSANGDDSAILNTGVAVFAGDLIADVALTAAGDDSTVNFTINTDVSGEISASSADWNGDLTVVASGQSSEIDLEGDIDGQWRGDVTVSDYYIDEESDEVIGDDAIVNINLDANQGFSGDLTVTALGDGSSLQVSIDVDEDFNFVSEVELIADGRDSYVEVSIDTDQNFIGDITGTASGFSSEVDLEVEADKNFTGDITLTASGTSSDIDFELDTNDGDFTGNIILNASGNSSDIDFSTEIDGASTGNFTITASGEDSRVDFSFDTDADINGDLIASATSADAYVEIDLVADNSVSGEIDADYLSSITMDTQITATASAFSAEVNLDVSVEVSVDVFGYSAGDEIGTVTASSLYLGDVVLTANSEDAEVYFDINVEALVSTDLDDSEITSISALAKFSGDITANATADDSFIGVDISIDSSVVGGSLTNSQRVEEADFEGDINLTASGFLSDISMDLWVDDDMVGNIDLIASGLGSAVYTVGIGPGDAEIDIGGDFTGTLSGLASGNSSDIGVSMEVGGDFNGDISLIATGIDSEILACIDVDGDINGDIILRADTSLPDYEHNGSDVSAEIHADDINGDIYIESANLAGGSDVGVYINARTPGIDISEQLVGDIFISGGYSNDVNVIFNDMFSDLVEMSGISGREIEDAENSFYGELNLEFNSDSRAVNYSYWYNAINEDSGEISDLHNRYMEINGFTGIQDSLDSINNLDTIEFNDFGDEGYISQFFGDGNGNNWGFYDNDLYVDGGVFADLQEFLADAHSTLKGGNDVYNADGDADLDYNAVQFYTGTIGDDFYLAVGSNVQNETGMSYLIRFNDFAADSSSFESLGLVNTDFVYNPD